MTVTAYDYESTGDNLFTVTVTSSLSGTVYYHWWRDGEYCGMTTAPAMTFYVAYLEQANVTVIDTNDADYDHTSSAPDVHRATRTLFWTATDDPCSYYLIEQQKDAGAWEEIARVHHSADEWQYHHQTDRLTDLSTYTWRITPVSENGQEGTVTTVGPEVVVRVPDAPNVTVTFDAGTSKVTFTEAS